MKGKGRMKYLRVTGQTLDNHLVGRTPDEVSYKIVGQNWLELNRT